MLTEKEMDHRAISFSPPDITERNSSNRPGLMPLMFKKLRKPYV